MFGSQILFMNLGPTEILIIALVVLLLFGGKKIPEPDVTKEEKKDE